MMCMRLFVVLLLCLPFVQALVLIEQIYYDAPGSDEGKEFVDVKNYGLEPTSIKNFTLYESGRELWSGINCESCFLFANETLRISVSSLPNTKGFIKLNASNYSDLLGYGQSEIFLGSPAKDVPSGYSLLRDAITKNNSVDFVQAELADLQNNSVAVKVEIQNVAPVLYDATITKENGSFFISSIAEDDNGIGDVLSYAYFLQDSLYETNVTGANMLPFSHNPVEISLPNPVSEISLAVIDSYGELSNFILVPIFTSFFEITEIKPVSVFPGDETELDISFLAGKDAIYTISIDSLYGKEQFDINSSITLSSEKGEIDVASLPITVPKGVPAGMYRGVLEIVIE